MVDAEFLMHRLPGQRLARVFEPMPMRIRRVKECVMFVPSLPRFLMAILALLAIRMLPAHAEIIYDNSADGGTTVYYSINEYGDEVRLGGPAEPDSALFEYTAIHQYRWKPRASPLTDDDLHCSGGDAIDRLYTARFNLERLFTKMSRTKSPADDLLDGHSRITERIQ